MANSSLGTRHCDGYLRDRVRAYRGSGLYISLPLCSCLRPCNVYDSVMFATLVCFATLLCDPALFATLYFCDPSLRPCTFATLYFCDLEFFTTLDFLRPFFATLLCDPAFFATLLCDPALLPPCAKHTRLSRSRTSSIPETNFSTRSTSYQRNGTKHYQVHDPGIPWKPMPIRRGGECSPLSNVLHLPPSSPLHSE